MASLSKAVSNRQWFAEHVTTTIEVHAPACIEEAERQLSDTDEQGVKVELSPLINGLVNRLRTVTRRMAEKDLAVGEEIADDPQYRDQRDNWHGELRTENISLKSIISSFYGESILSVYGLSGEIPTNLDQLITSSKNVIQLLKKTPLPVPAKKGLQQLDGTLLADELSEKVQAAEQALRNIKKEEKELELAVRDRDISIGIWQKVSSPTATIFAEILKLGGRNDLAERVRPTARRMSGTEEPPVEPETPVTPTVNSMAGVGA